MEVLNPQIKRLIVQLEKELDLIGADRKLLLDQLKVAIFNDHLFPVFICTHNSRRSQLAEVWLHVLSSYYGTHIAAYSGGTQATAFNPRMVKALRTLGFELVAEDESQPNPVYRMGEGQKLFSKTYDDPFNPKRDLVAVMVCSDADENCPVVFGANRRIPLRYDDPKAFDDTELEEQAYLNKVLEVGREMTYLFKTA